MHKDGLNLDTESARVLYKFMARHAHNSAYLGCQTYGSFCNAIDKYDELVGQIKQQMLDGGEEVLKAAQAGLTGYGWLMWAELLRLTIWEEGAGKSGWFVAGLILYNNVANPYYASTSRSVGFGKNILVPVKRLLNGVINRYPHIATHVSDDDPQAIRFAKYMGFEPTGVGFEINGRTYSEFVLKKGV